MVIATKVFFITYSSWKQKG